MLATEFEVALVVGRHGHDRSRAVAHDHEIADPDGHCFAAVRIDREPSGREAFLFQVVGTLRGSGRRHFVAAFGEAEFRDQRVQGSEDQAGRAEDRVDPRREDPDPLAAALYREVDLRARRASDPVALHRQDALWPPVLQLVERAKQLVSVCRRPGRTIARAPAAGPGCPRVSSSNRRPPARWRAPWRNPGTN